MHPSGASARPFPDQAFSRAGQGACAQRVHAGADRVSDAVTFREATRRFQRELLEQTLCDTDWNMTETARRLALARSHIYNLVRTFELVREASPSQLGEES